METIKLGILGMGTVASGLINIIEFNNSKIIETLNKELIINKVLVKSLNKQRDVKLPQDVYTTDAYEVINDKDVQILVELIGGINPAFEYIKAALNNKKHVVTANKALIATHGQELEELAILNGVKLMYEASVAGGIPIINTISENLVQNEFEQIIGIINGTTNYILTQMTENNLGYDQAVKEAQELGFAEADPSSDVEGDDAAYKIAILSSIAYGQRINIKDVLKEGITKVTREDIRLAKKFDYNIKLLAYSTKKNNEIEIVVQPTFVPIAHPLSTVKNEFNAILLIGNAVGELMFCGKGAGSLPTGSAVLGDIISIAKNDKVIKNEIKYENKYKIVNKSMKKYYIRLEVFFASDILEKITKVFDENNIEGYPGYPSMLRRENFNNIVPYAFITKKVERKKLYAVLKEINELDCISSIGCVAMLEDFD